MELYDWIFVATTPIYCLGIHYLFLIMGRKPEKSLALPLSYLFTSVINTGLHLGLNIPAVTGIANLILFFWISGHYQENKLARFYSTSLFFSFGLSIEMVLVGWTGVSVVLFDYAPYYSHFSVVLLRIIHFTLAYFIYGWRREKSSGFSLSGWYYAGYAVIISGVLYLFFGFILNESMVGMPLVLASFVVLLVVFLVLHMDEKSKNAFSQHSENQLLREQAIAFQNQQELISQSLHHSKALKHDMKNQIFVLKSLISQGNQAEIALQTEKILAHIEGEKILANSGHFVVDSLINYKLSGSSHVNITINLQISEELPMIFYDLTVVLGNLLDNAVTATEHQKQDAFINIHLDHDRGNLMIEITNSFDGKVHFHKGIYHSTKPFATNHGYGLSNVKEVVEKYDGVFSAKHGSDFFTVNAVIPLVK